LTVLSDAPRRNCIKTWYGAAVIAALELLGELVRITTGAN